MTTNFCEVNDNNCSNYYAKGLCRLHYGRRRDGIPMGQPKREDQVGRVCSYEGCGRKSYTKGLCHTHDMQMRSTGELWEINGFVRTGFKISKGNRIGSVPVDACSEPGCDTLSRHRGRCSAHHQDVMQGIIDPRTPYDKTLKTCSLIDCKGKYANDTGLCYRHVHTAKRFGVTHDRLIELFRLGGGKCECCGDQLSFLDTSKSPHVDHDHACCETKGLSCGTCVRGILCYRCNSGLGYFRDSEENLRNAVEYLSRTQL